MAINKLANATGCERAEEKERSVVAQDLRYGEKNARSVRERLQLRHAAAGRSLYSTDTSTMRKTLMQRMQRHVGFESGSSTRIGITISRNGD